MARPRSEDKRNAIMAAATRVIATKGLDAPTAMIAQEAGVANGSLFTYFATKSELFNQLYFELKTELALSALEGLPAGAGPREQLFHIWSQWMSLAVSSPPKRRALAQLHVCDDISPAIRAKVHEAMKDIVFLLEKIRSKGSLRNVPMGFVFAVLNALADATTDFMIHDPANAKRHCRVGFDALWRAIS